MGEKSTHRISTLDSSAGKGFLSVAERQKKLKGYVRVFPQSPGVYRMFDQDDRICYIGKAKRLRSRVMSYFNGSEKRQITHLLVRRVCRVDYLVTNSEAEALILESNLIKKHQPIFNIDLKDNKSYPYLMLITRPFPRLVKTRNVKSYGEYFGPYTNVQLMEAYLEAVNKLYPLKKCRQVKFPKGFKPCLYFHIDECLDYCTGNVKPEKTKEIVKEIKQLLRGNTKAVIDKLKKKIGEESAKRNFEKAQTLKEAMETLQSISHRQAVTNTGEDDFDAIHFVTSERYLVIALLQFREAKLQNKHVFEFPTALFSSNDERNYSLLLADILGRFLYDYYKVDTEAIDHVLLPEELFESSEAELKVAMETAYEAKNKARIADGQPPLVVPQLQVPLQGKKKRFLTLAQVNATFSMQELMHKKRGVEVLRLLKRDLQLPRLPKTIESFDIANTGDNHIIAGMVRFVEGREDKSGYRLFNISLTSRQDDFLSLKEAVFRRYSRLLKERKALPDLVVIDGGKGQLSSALSSLQQLNLGKLPTISLAKKDEWVYLPKAKEPLVLKHNSESLRFLVRLRDETHRYVNSSHVRKRDKAQLKVGLQKIEGIGEKKIKTLLTHFDSLEAIRNSTLEQIRALPFFGEKDHEALMRYFASNKHQLQSLYSTAKSRNEKAEDEKGFQEHEKT